MLVKERTVRSHISSRRSKTHRGALSPGRCPLWTPSCFEWSRVLCSTKSASRTPNSALPLPPHKLRSVPCDSKFRHSSSFRGRDSGVPSYPISTAPLSALVFGRLESVSGPLLRSSEDPKVSPRPRRTSLVRLDPNVDQVVPCPSIRVPCI